MFQAQEMLPVWSALVPALRSGKDVWDEAHPRHPGGVWEYLKVAAFMCSLPPCVICLHVFFASICLAH